MQDRQSFDNVIELIVELRDSGRTELINDLHEHTVQRLK
jgi:hypothetical protein